jgi:hypothetical protein
MEGSRNVSKQWNSVELVQPAGQRIVQTIAAQSHLRDYEVTLPEEHPAALAPGGRGW